MGLLEVLIVVILIVWILGLGASYTFGGALHLLLIIVVILVVLRLLGKKL